MISAELSGVEVLYTRTDDHFVKLQDRAWIANDNEVDLFISIHRNLSTSSKPFGTETYVMRLHKSEKNLEVAKTENAAILLEEDYQEQYDGFDSNLDEDYIVLNMFLSANIKQSLEFSQFLQESDANHRWNVPQGSSPGRFCYTISYYNTCRTAPYRISQ